MIDQKIKSFLIKKQSLSFKSELFSDLFNLTYCNDIKLLEYKILHLIFNLNRTNKIFENQSNKHLDPFREIFYYSSLEKDLHMIRKSALSIIKNYILTERLNIILSKSYTSKRLCQVLKDNNKDVVYNYCLLKKELNLQEIIDYLIELHGFDLDDFLEEDWGFQSEKISHYKNIFLMEISKGIGNVS